MAVVTAIGLIKMGSQVAVLRLTSVQTVGESALISSYANAAFSLLIPLAFIVLMLSMRQRMQASEV
jgi:hypothetical protein